jgi:Ulp1 family protease
VDNALGPGNASETLADGFKISITRSDMVTLSNLNWLNDEVIQLIKILYRLEDMYVLFTGWEICPY